MAIKTISTGIFSYEEMSNPTKAERKFIRERALSLLNLESRLEALQAAATEILQAAGMRFFPGGGESKINVKDWNEKHELRDAMEVLSYIGILRDALKEGKIERAVTVALNLGQVSMRLYVRPHEKPAKAGKAALKNLQKGRKGGTGRYDDARERHEQWKEYAKTITHHHSARQIAALVAAHFSVNPDTVRKALRNK